MEQLCPYRFLFDGPVPPGYSRIHSTETLPFSFKTLLASVDVIMTKPGYGTIVEAVALQQPVVYVRRYNFADEPPLVDYLHRYGRGVEFSSTTSRKAAGSSLATSIGHTAAFVAAATNRRRRGSRCDRSILSGVGDSMLLLALS